MNENSGRQAQQYLQALLTDEQSVGEGAGDSESHLSGGAYGAGSFVTASGLKLNSNQATQLKNGAILLAHMGCCYQLEPETQRITFLFELVREPATYLWACVPDRHGNVYCSVSGTTAANDLYLRQGAQFGSEFGAIVKVNNVERRLDVIVEDSVVDPWGMEFINEDHLLFADFDGWGGDADTGQGGSVKIIDVRSGAFEVVAQGGELIDPHMATLDKEGDLWIANAMHQQYDGMVVRIAHGNEQTVVYPRHGPGSGILCGLFPSANEEEVIFVIIDWPYMQKSSVCALNKSTGDVQVLLDASRNEPKIYAMHGAVDSGGILWVPESFDGELIGYDLAKRKIVERIDISSITSRALGHGVRGVYDSFTFCEGAYSVPNQVHNVFEKAPSE